MSKCATCSSGINKQKPGISCAGRCKKAFHASCVKIPIEFLKLMDVPGHSWRCGDCADNSANILNEDIPTTSGSNDLICIMKSIQDDLKNLNSKYDTLLESVTFCSDKLTNFENALTKLDGRVSTIEKIAKENMSMRNDIKLLSNRVDQFEQYTRVNNLEIQGVPEKTGENVYTIIETIGNTVGCKITRNDVDIAHRVSHMSPNNKTPKAIIVRFISRLRRDNFLAAAKNFRKTTNRKDPGIAVENISNKLFVNEHLTSKNKILLAKAKNTAKDKEFKYVWTKYGRVFMRRNDTSAIFKVNCETDLEKLN